MDDLVERVAMSIYDKDVLRIALGDLETAWKSDRDDIRADFRARARAVIAVMREPTEAMVDAADIAQYQLGYGGVVEAWQLMIDATLNPTACATATS
ncbi:MAG TPA: hypothetical protein PLO16_12700 [Acidocella sp.]|nr:hypothetical protein [Acidocella sp.]